MQYDWKEQPRLLPGSPCPEVLSLVQTVRRIKWKDQKIATDIGVILDNLEAHAKPPATTVTYKDVGEFWLFLLHTKERIRSQYKDLERKQRIDKACLERGFLGNATRQQKALHNFNARSLKLKDCGHDEKAFNVCVSIFTKTAIHAEVSRAREEEFVENSQGHMVLKPPDEVVSMEEALAQAEREELEVAMRRASAKETVKRGDNLFDTAAKR